MCGRRRPDLQLLEVVEIRALVLEFQLFVMVSVRQFVKRTLIFACCILAVGCVTDDVKNDKVEVQDTPPASSAADLSKSTPTTEPTYKAKPAATVLAAARDGYGPAQYVLGEQYLQNRGNLLENREGVRLIQAAAEQGVPVALFRLALLHANGDGVSRDPVLATAFKELSVNLTTGNGDKWGVSGLTALLNPVLNSIKLTPEQKISVRDFVRDWKPKPSPMTDRLKPLGWQRAVVRR